MGVLQYHGSLFSIGIHLLKKHACQLRRLVPNPAEVELPTKWFSVSRTKTANLSGRRQMRDVDCRNQTMSHVIHNRVSLKNHRRGRRDPRRVKTDQLIPCSAYIPPINQSFRVASFFPFPIDQLLAELDAFLRGRHPTTTV